MPNVDQAKDWYKANDPVHGFDHILRVLMLAERLGEKEGADLEILRAAVLLHDASGGRATDDGRREHQHLSAEFAGEVLAEENWPIDRIQAVQHCIRSHRFRGDEQPKSLEAKILFDADKLDVIGAFGVARTIAYDVEVGQPIFAEPSERFRRSGKKEADEPHSSYHEFLFKLGRIKDHLYTSSARELAEGRQEFLVNFFEQMLAEARGER